MSHTNSSTINLLIDLIRKPSVTPEDKGCQTLIGSRLQAAGFKLEPMNAGGVTNLWARKGDSSPLLVFAGHTDVVPTGDTDSWHHPPFSATIDKGYVWGRGAADMKGGVAAMITASERFLNNNLSHKGSIAILLTSDEEGPATHGTAHVIDQLQNRAEPIDYCIIGEPTSNKTLGDVIRHGRRGSLGATMSVQGIQGHVAYPQLADNPVHKTAPMLAELTGIEWDSGDDHFPKTTLQISNIHAGTGASNVIPGSLIVDFNLRYGPATSIEHIQETLSALCKKYQLEASLQWNDSARPFITNPGTLTDCVQQAIRQHTNQNATLDTGGGTSDGRFVAPTGAQVIEFGPINATIHQVDERISCADIDTLSMIYETVLEQLLGHQ